MLFNCQLAQRKQLMLSLKAFSIQARYSTSSATLSTSSLFWVKLLAKQARRTRAHLSLSWALTAWKGCISHRGFPKGFPIGVSHRGRVVSHTLWSFWLCPSTTGLQACGGKGELAICRHALLHGRGTCLSLGVVVLWMEWLVEAVCYDAIKYVPHVYLLISFVFSSSNEFLAFSFCQRWVGLTQPDLSFVISRLSPVRTVLKVLPRSVKPCRGGRGCSVHGAIGWLFETLVGDHLLLQGNEGVLHAAAGWGPVSQVTVLGEVNLAILLVHTWDVDAGVEFDTWWLTWIVFTAHNAQEVDAVLELGVWWTNNGTVPVGEGLIIWVVETVGDSLVRKLSLLSLLKLLVQGESSWHCSHVKQDRKDILVNKNVSSN